MRALPLLYLFALTAAQAQTPLQQQIIAIAAQAQGIVQVACILPGTTLNCDLNPGNHPPMQSMFKYPLALTVLHLADTGKLLPSQQAGEPLETTLDRTVRFLPQDRILPETYSPLQDRYPQANADVTLRELLQLAAGKSDNAATETLLRIIGGPATVQTYIRSIGITAFQLEDGEQTLAHDPKAQYRNWISPAAATQLLQRLIPDPKAGTAPPLSPAANAFLLQTLTASTTTPNRLRAGLPPGTPLAHKSGTSGQHHGIAEATNDIGLITLPDGRHLALAVFITNAHADEPTRDRTIAEIARAAYIAALQTR